MDINKDLEMLRLVRHYEKDVEICTALDHAMKALAVWERTRRALYDVPKDEVGLMDKAKELTIIRKHFEEL